MKEQKSLIKPFIEIYYNKNYKQIKNHSHSVENYFNKLLELEYSNKQNFWSVYLFLFNIFYSI